jgi:hypothetical protein
MGLFTSTFTHTHTTNLTLAQSPQSKAPQSQQSTSETQYKAALSLLHDPAAIITLNPLVTHFEEIEPSSIDIESRFPPTQTSTSDAQDPFSESTATERKYFRITDSKPLLYGWYTYKFDYYISYLRVDGGCDTVVAAPGGVSIEGSWRVSAEAGTDAGEDEELRLLEKATVTCPSIFAVFIKGTLGSSHEEMHQKFVEKWKGKLLE